MAAALLFGFGWVVRGLGLSAPGKGFRRDGGELGCHPSRGGIAAGDPAGACLTRAACARVIAARPCPVC